MLLVGLAFAIVACGPGDGARDDVPAVTTTPATCPAVCARQRQLCQSNTDCDLSCQLTDTLVAKCGCQAEAQRAFDCRAKLNVCDVNDTLCPSTEYSECVTTRCEPPTCENVCARQNALCGTAEDCGATCAGLRDLVFRSGCDAQYQEGLACLDEKDVCDSNETVCPATSFTTCVQSYCAANAADPACT